MVSGIFHSSGTLAALTKRIRKILLIRAKGSGLGFRVQGLGFRILRVGLRFWGLAFWFYF